MQRLRRLIPLLARSRETVLIIGETGTGKELFARALHDQSPRAAGPFVAHNVAATPGELAESLFFGHSRGAFSGAHADHPGLFEQAHGGTLLLDELDSLPLPLQAKLLRTLECLRVQRLGAAAEREIDVRIVAATAVDPAELVAAGAFRADLYYRLRQLEVVMPPLRERMEDLPALAAHVLDEYGREQGRAVRLSSGAEVLLLAHAWPGNVRELRHALRGAATLAGREAIQPQHLPRALRERQDDGPGVAARLEDVEYLAIQRALERTSGNQSRAAQLLGIDRGTLARKLRRHDA
jgi:transcriptional regulator with PAS, ATPase and Fis domain